MLISTLRLQWRLTYHRTASYKLLTLAGLFCAGIGYLLLILLWSGNTNIWLSLLIAPGGFGSGIVLSTTFVGLAAGIEEPQMAIASTGLYLSANIGTLVGASLASSILQTTLRQGLSDDLTKFRGWEMVCTVCILVDAALILIECRFATELYPILTTSTRLMVL